MSYVCQFQLQFINQIYTMGTSCYNKPKSESKVLFTGDQQPKDIEQFKNCNKAPLTFQLSISNIKLKYIPYETATINFKIDQILNFTTEKKKKTKENNIKWNAQKKIKLTLNQYELRKKFLNMTVSAEGGNKVAQIQLNLFKILTGPYHQDFPLNYHKNTSGRISADIRITQFIEIFIQSEMASVNLIKQRPQELFNYTLKTIILSNQQAEQSDSSYNIQLSINKEINNIEEQILSTKQITKMNSLRKQKSVKEQLHKITWYSNEAQNRGLTLPKIKTQILVTDLSTGSFQFSVWTYENSFKQAKKQPWNQTNTLCGQCYIPFNKILEKQFQLIEKQNIMYQHRKLQLTQKIWKQGKLIGEMKMKLTMIIPKYYKQMIVFVRTEDGIQKTSPIFNISQDHKIDCPQLRNLSKLKDQLQQLNIKIAQCLHHQKKQFQIKKLKQQIKFNLYKIQPILTVTVKQSVSLYSYSSLTDLMNGQSTIIEIGFKLLQYLQEQQTSLHDICSKCMTALLRRGEFTLHNIGFQQVNKNNKEKLQLAVKFQTFLYRNLKIVLTCLNKKALRQNQKVYVQLFCAYSFFRIPEFRKSLLTVITKGQDAPLQELEVTHFMANKRFQETQDLFQILFNWEQNFYKYMINNQNSKKNYKQLNQILQKNLWKHRIEKRGMAFFFFIIYWLQYVQEIAVNSQNIKWKYLPGYLELLRAFLAQMKNRSITAYPDSLKEACLKLLINQKLLNIFIGIIFQKTNVYDSTTVLNTLEIINSYFTTLSKRNKQLPTMFNYPYFLVGIKEILYMEHAFSVAKCLLVIYTNYNMFNPQFKHDINQLLLGKLFFRLFLNWSKNIRTIFYHLLVFRIYLQANILIKSHQNKNLKIQYHNNQEIKKKYLTLKDILQKAYEKKQEDISKKVANNFEKQYFKKMKIKKMIKSNINPHNLRRLATIRNLKYTPPASPTDKKIYYNSEFVPSIKITEQKAESIQSEKAILYINKIQIKQRNSGKQVVKTENYASQIQNSIDKNGPDKKKWVKKLTINLQDIEIQDIPSEYLQYLNISLKQFKKIEVLFEKDYIYATEKDVVPVVEIRIPIDEVEIRPEEIDQW